MPVYIQRDDPDIYLHTEELFFALVSALVDIVYYLPINFMRELGSR